MTLIIKQNPKQAKKSLLNTETLSNMAQKVNNSEELLKTIHDLGKRYF